MLQSVVAAIFFAIQNVSNKFFSRDFKNGLYPLAVLNAMALLMGTVALAVLFRPGMIPSGALLYAGLFGLLFDITISLIVVTMTRGPLGMSNLIIDMSVVVSVLFGALVWKEPITPLRGAAFALLLISLVSIALPDQKESGKVRLSWLITALVTMLFNGSLGVAQKAAFAQFPDLSSTDFTFWSLAAGALFCAIAAAALKLFKKARFAEGEPIRRLPLIAAGVGLGTAAAYYFQNWALKVAPSVVVFPVVIGLNVSFLMIISVLFFGERLSLRKGVAFALGMAGILMMNF